MIKKKYLSTFNNPQKESKWKHDTAIKNLIIDDKLFEKINNDLAIEFSMYDDN